MGSIGVSACYGGGALWGIGYGIGIARGLLDAGVALDVAPSIGTSAGVWVAAATHLGTPIDKLARIEINPPYAEGGVLEGFGRFAFGDAIAPGVWGTVVDATDLAGVELLHAGDHPAGLVAAASSAVPGLFLPVDVQGRTFVDGMMGGSCTYAHLAPDSDHLVVVAPMAAPVFPGAESQLAALHRELDVWSARNPGAVVDVFVPDDACCELVGPDPDLFELRLALEVAERAFAQAARQLAAA